MAGVDEMMKELEIKGLQRLVEVCQKNSLQVDCPAPEELLISPGDVFLGQSFDPLLAALYAQTDGAMLGDLQIYPLKEPENTVLRINRSKRRFGEEPYLSTLLFGQIPMLAYYLATVPPLADSKGVQPVVFIDGYEAGRVLPVASNVDVFLSLFSVYLERAVAAPDFSLERRVALHFPASVLDVVARDLSLVTALSSGGYDRLCHADESREWISKVVDAVR
jgi:hypothetical protein